MVCITSLLTCHNRRELTLACLDRLAGMKLPDDVALNVVLVDDGSTDGTAEAVHYAHPKVTILTGSGHLYWCGGMRLAWREAAQKDPDYYLLVNDDTLLEDHALNSLLEICSSPVERTIAVGTIADKDSGEVIYGAVNHQIGVLGPADSAPCDTFTANCVLIPRQVFRELGILHDAYTHSMGDIDYGILATRRGIKIRKSSSFLGSCGSNPVAGTWRDKSLPRLRRFHLLQQPKGLPFGEWLVFTRRNYGWRWPYYSISPFLRILAGR